MREAEVGPAQEAMTACGHEHASGPPRWHGESASVTGRNRCNAKDWPRAIKRHGLLGDDVGKRLIVDVPPCTIRLEPNRPGLGVKRSEFVVDTRANNLGGQINRGREVVGASMRRIIRVVD